MPWIGKPFITAAVWSKCPSQHCSSHFIEYIEREIPYPKLFKKYLIPNQPCMFSKKFTEDWNCRKNWVTADGKPNFQRLLHEFGEQRIIFHYTCINVAKEYNSNPKQIMPFKEFMQYWREYIQNGHSAPKGCLYVKDWHMQRYSSSKATLKNDGLFKPNFGSNMD
uniref:Uncharacterized protein n=1 Tax=Sinocyclocheilus anshuiensis TaxID=1608454 RepID=A0A671QIZ9_9TELE